MTVPRHIAIIMDGNGRWAKKRFLPRYFGHREGVNALKKIVKYCGNDTDIEILTVYAFSTENWHRPTKEVNFLLKLMEEAFSVNIDELIQEGVRIKVLGDLATMPLAQQHLWKRAEAKTKDNTKLLLNVAFNYGGRNEIVNAATQIAKKVASGQLAWDHITPDIFSDHLYSSRLIDPDLVIRTGGEYRTSNFLLWQTAYSEWYFTQVLWPDFDETEFQKALVCYAQRQRRFGQIQEDESGR